MYLCNLENEVNSIHNESGEFKENRVKGDKQLQDINHSTSWLAKKFDDYEKERKEKDHVYRESAKQQHKHGKMN